MKRKPERTRRVHSANEGKKHMTNEEIQLAARAAHEANRAFGAVVRGVIAHYEGT